MLLLRLSCIAGTPQFPSLPNRLDSTAPPLVADVQKENAWQLYLGITIRHYLSHLIAIGLYRWGVRVWGGCGVGGVCVCVCVVGGGGGAGADGGRIWLH